MLGLATVVLGRLMTASSIRTSQILNPLNVLACFLSLLDHSHTLHYAAIFVKTVKHYFDNEGGPSRFVIVIVIVHASSASIVVVHVRDVVTAKAIGVTTAGVVFAACHVHILS